MWPWLVLVGVLVVGGCSALVVGGAAWFTSAVRAPVDAANTYLDEARAGTASSTACPGAEAPGAEITSSTTQHLHEVEVTSGHAEVAGTLTLEDGTRAAIDLVLERASDGWCVRDADVR